MNDQPKERSRRPIAANRKAFHDYHILERLEAGIALTGSEVKSLREGRLQLKDSYARVEQGELYLLKAHISPYKAGGYANHEPERPRKLLVHRRELKRLIGKTEQKGLTLIPLQFYFLGPYVKVELGLARGKKVHDKRATLRERDLAREAHAAIKERL
ncbi:MAG TPA: SsrA-binding protein SmpB [Acidobacteriota bacterium]